jgi:drug/metabolite transporter (DMT)-like permease
VGLRLVSPLLFVGVRLVAAALLLALAMVAGRRSWAALRGRWHHLAVAGALVNGVTLSTFHVGMVTENVAVMALMQSLSPMLIALSAVPLLGERLRASQWLGLILGTVGVAIVVAPRALESPAGWRAVSLGLDRGHGALLLPAGARDGGPGGGQLLPRPRDGGAGRVGAPGGAPDPAGRRRLRDRLRGRVPGGPRPRPARAPAPA